LKPFTTRQRIDQCLTVLRNSTGLNYQLDISGIPTGYKLVMTDLTTGGEWDVTHRMSPKIFLDFIYNLNTVLYAQENRRKDARFLLRTEDKNADI